MLSHKQVKRKSDNLLCNGVHIDLVGTQVKYTANKG